MTLKQYMLENAKNPKEAYKLYEKAKELKLTNASRHTYERLCRKNFSKIEKRDLVGEVKRISNEDGTIESTINTHTDIKSVKEMAEYCNINIEDYIIPPKVVSNTWGNAENPNWQFKIWWTPKYKKGDLKPREAAKEFEKLIKGISLPKRKFLPIEDNGKTVVIGLTDSHIGQLTWGEEIGNPEFGNWDLNIATSELLKVIDFYLSYYKDKNVKKFILPIGSDLFNVNSQLSTINGTLQDEDARTGKTFRKIMETMIIIIESFADIAPIDCVYIPGNHDKDVSYDLIVGLCAAFRKQKDRINIDASPQDHKYIKIGNTLIGIAHGKVKGKDLKPTDLPQIMARDVKELWGKTLYHEWLIGHYHKLKDLVSDDLNGTIIRVMPSITQLSYWTYSSGLKSTRQMEAFEYDDIDGHIATIVYRP